MRHMSLSVTVAALGVMMLTGPIDSTQATERARVYVARHHTGAHAARRACYAARHMLAHMRPAGPVLSVAAILA
jgi:hypothetical protein